MKSAVFLDRDGVVNRSIVRDGRPYAPRTIEEFVIIPGVPEAVAKFRDAGYLVIVVTNQPDVGSGRQRRETVEAMHALLSERVRVDDIKVCYHTDADQCACRKPRPGMLLEAAEEHDIALDHSWMIGDRWRDVEAGRSAGCRPIFIDLGYDEPFPQGADLIVVRSLNEAVPFVVGAVETLPTP